MPPIAPGQQLYRWLVDRYPRAEPANWVQKIGADFPDPDLEQLLYESTIVMLLRRLLANGERHRRLYGDAAERQFKTNYLSRHLAMSTCAPEVSALVFKSLEAADQDIPRSLSNRLRTEYLRLRARCALCARSIDYGLTSIPNDPTYDPLQDFAFSLDHIWPSSLGGPSEEWNLRPAHRSCNSRRSDMLGGVDSHYERFHVKVPDSDASYAADFDNLRRLAVRARTHFCCAMCDVDANRTTRDFAFSRRNEVEGDNIINTQWLCEGCQ